MKKQLAAAVAVSLLISFNTQSAQSLELISLSVYPQLELNSQVVTGVRAITTGSEVKNMDTNSSKAMPVPASKSAASTKQVTDKDLTIEGKVEKTQSDSLYYGQSAEELQQLVFDVAQKIMRANGMNRNITIKYVDKDVENANVNISNEIKVYKGLIKACQTEDELAYVIGHEMGHSNSYHVAKGIGVNAAGSVGNAAAVYGISRATNNYWARAGVSTAAELATQLGSSKIDRVQETNADLLSIDYIIKAGYNPLASIAIMNKIGSSYLDVLSDHPSTDKRVTKMYNYIMRKYPEYVSSGYKSVYYDQALTTINNINRNYK